ncbi:DUF2959 domain-containing protein [Stutzerimonas tarimensis]|uniref:DUF2959 domain-containing protein n=1 Tax=Stutzerimonas tarimensis TaxID=1507735 RepID=A0ABV7TC08_9GAMM
MRQLCLFWITLFLLAGCQSTYYAALERAGIHKRDILVDRVGDARDSQQQAQQQFRDALERYRSVVQVEGGELEVRYEALDREYQASERAARNVRNRIEGVEDVANALFREWRRELRDYTNRDLRAASERELKRTEQQYEALIQRMKAAEKRIEPVLGVLRDQVLFLKHNLNARAIGALQGEYRTLSANVDELVAEMQRAIDEADLFIRRMQSAE